MLATYMTYLSAVLAVFFCLICSYTDIKYRKIQNKYIVLMVFIGIYTQFVYHYLNRVSDVEVITLILGGLMISFLLYYWGIWSPGDAKLYFACVLLLPPIGFLSAPASGITYIPVVLAVNIFVPCLVIVIALAFLKTTRAQKAAVLHSLVRGKRTLKDFVFLAPFILIVFSVLRQWLNWVLAPILAILGLPLYIYYLIYLSLSIVAARKILTEIRRIINGKHFTLSLIVSGFVTVGLAMFTPTSVLLISLGVLLGFAIFRTMLMALLHTIFIQKVSVMDLEAHMIPIQQITQFKDSNGDLKYTLVSSNEPVSSDAVVLPATTTGLPPDILAKVKKMCKEGRFEGFSNEIEVYRSFCFAPAICFGVILTIVCQGPFYTI